MASVSSGRRRGTPSSVRLRKQCWTRRSDGLGSELHRQVQVNSVLHPRQLPVRDLLDALDPVAQGVDVDVELLGRALPRAGVTQEMLERLDELGVVLGVVGDERLEQAGAKCASQLRRA